MSKELVIKFNSVIMGMITHITDYYEDTHLATVKLILGDVIEKMPEELISYFMLNIYRNDTYRENILAQNDKFFLNEDFGNLTNGDKDKVSKLFEFKQLWTKIDENTKNFIKKSMCALIKLTQKYIMTL